MFVTKRHIFMTVVSNNGQIILNDDIVLAAVDITLSMFRAIKHR